MQECIGVFHSMCNGKAVLFLFAQRIKIIRIKRFHFNCQLSVTFSIIFIIFVQLIFVGKDILLFKTFY